MKYFVAHLLNGDAYQYHLSLTKELSDRFRITPLHERVDPHISIKSFEANDYEIGQVEILLGRVAQRSSPAPLMIEGFGRFGYKTLFLDVQKSRAATLFARECITEMNALPWMRSVAYEGEKLHSSVARYLRFSQSKKIWHLLRKRETPHFRTQLDAITILKKPGRRWEKHRTFVLGAPSMQSSICSDFVSTPAVTI